MMKLIIYGLIIYLLYKVIFEIVIPISNGVNKVRKNMEQVQRQQAEAFKRAQEAPVQNNTSQENKSAPKKEKSMHEEYIDFEEVKK
jgi:Sec-independent protein translocase protein TatA